MSADLKAPRRVEYAFIGRTADGLRIFVSYGLDFSNGTRDVMSTEHETIPMPPTLSISGGTVDRRHDFEHGGQIIDDLRTAKPDPQSSWTQADIDSLVAIWERWHLNTMRAGCAHQPKSSIVYENKPYRRVDLENTPRCPVTGYKWGSAWLAEPIPDDVLVEFHRLMDLPIGPAPTWLRP